MQPERSHTISRVYTGSARLINAMINVMINAMINVRADRLPSASPAQCRTCVAAPEAPRLIFT